MAGSALVVRRTYPEATLALVLTAYEVQVLVADTEAISGLAAVLLAMCEAGVWAERRGAVLILIVVLAWIVLQSADLADVALGLLVVSGPLLAGQLVRSRQLLLEELQRSNAELTAERDETARLAVAEERARIAREVHDVSGPLSSRSGDASGRAGSCTVTTGVTRDGCATGAGKVLQAFPDCRTERAHPSAAAHEDHAPPGARVARGREHRRGHQGDDAAGRSVSGCGRAEGRAVIRSVRQVRRG